MKFIVRSNTYDADKRCDSPFVGAPPQGGVSGSKEWLRLCKTLLYNNCTVRYLARHLLPRHCSPNKYI